VAAVLVVPLVVVVAAAIALRAAFPWPVGRVETHGTVVLLQGSPYYWVADEAGTLHWVSDTRALVGRYVRWSDVREVTPEQLRRSRRGAPWFSAPIAFVRDGGALYLVRWDAGLKWPALLRVPSLEALSVFGVTAAVIDQRVTDGDTWERMIGLPVDDLAAPFTPVTDDLPALWRAGMWSGGWEGTGIQSYPELDYPVSIALSPPVVDPGVGVVLGTVSYPSFPCGGQLGLVAVSVEEVVLTERLTAGLEHCTDQGRVTLTRRTPTRLFYVWTLPDEQITVTSQLQQAAAR
jgi:hypothetical protein